MAGEVGFQPMVLAADMQRGWAMAHLGAPQAGAALLRRTMAELDASRLVALRPCLLGMLAEVEMLDGRPEAALAVADAAIQEVSRRGDRFYLPEIHRLKGEMLRASGSDAGDLARVCFEQALEEAEAQGAVPFRDRARESLARSPATLS
jgi:predicted ATPase